MICKVTENSQLNACLNIIHKSFQTVAVDMGLTKETVRAIRIYAIKKITRAIKVRQFYVFV